MTKVVALYSVLIAIACGCNGSGDRGSGIDGGKRVVDLNEAEATALCEYLAELGGAQRVIACDAATTLTIGYASTVECAAQYDKFKAKRRGRRDLR